MTQPTFFFYDLETSGLDPRDDRIMQFAGQRASLNLEPLGEPINLLVKMSDDTLPSPSAIMVTKITPQSTLEAGLSEAELCRFLQTQVFTPHTITVGYNTIRFDDEFIRHLFWRNFYEPYTWQWQDGRSRWDLLDLVRMTRALRPDGINWPVVNGKATNRLELITELNNISHENTHDALSDVFAAIDVARLVKQHQPELYQYLFKLRDKNLVKQLVNLDSKKPFVYTSGRYGSEYGFTTIAFPFAPGRNGNVLVFDLRYNLEELLEKSPTSFHPIVKELSYNKCPAVAPLSVLDKNRGWQRLELNKDTVQRNLDILLKHPEFAEAMRTESEAKTWDPPIDPESALYESFLNDSDRTKCSAIIDLDADALADFHPGFLDERLADLLLHYKAKNFPTALSAKESRRWEKYRRARLERQAPNFLKELTELEKIPKDEFILEELKLWYQSLLPTDEED